MNGVEGSENTGHLQVCLDQIRVMNSYKTAPAASEDELKALQEKNDKNHTKLLFLNHEIDGYKSQI